MSLQGKSSVFELECMAPLIQLVQSYQQATGYIGTNQWLRSAQVIADHIRALLFLIADGAPQPGKGGQARIIRMLIRGIMTHQKILAITQAGFIPSLIETALNLYQNQNPGLKAGYKRLLTYFAREGECFERTLSASYCQLDKLIQNGGNGSISGEQALDLVKRHGLPFALLEVTLAKRGIRLNEGEYWDAHTRWQHIMGNNSSSSNTSALAAQSGYTGSWR
jgi:alanyl-tRNA synthetase